MARTDQPQKPSSRLFGVLKFKSTVDAAPPPPPKEPSLVPPPSMFYNKALFSRSATSLCPDAPPSSSPLSSATLEFGRRANGRAAAASPVPSASGRSSTRDYLPSPSIDGSTDSSGSHPNNQDIYLCTNASSSAVSMKPKKSVFKLASLAKRNRSRKDLSETASTSGIISIGEPDREPDDGISMPWNFQHHIHVDEGYIGLPPSWSAALSQVGFGEDEIAAIHARRRAAVTGLASSPSLTNLHPTHASESPHELTTTAPSTSASASSSATLLDPVPRSTSLGKGRDVIAIHPPSTYSVATSTASGLTPAPSPRAPSFSMKHLVSGIKSSLSSDSASTKEATTRSRTPERAKGEESDQYVFVDGDGPEENGERSMGDETLIEPYPFDTSSISSHSSRARQDQQTPRTPTFPQIQVHRTQSESRRVPFPSPASRAPSPLSHSATLPIPTPPRRYAYSNTSHSSHSNPRPELLLVLPQTPPRRVYHVVNASLDSTAGESYAEPPPAYVSPKKDEWTPKKEKEGAVPQPVPSMSAERNPGDRDGLDSSNGISVSFSDYTGSSLADIPGTADEVLDISSYYCDDPVHVSDAEMGPKQQTDAISPTPPLVVDKRTSKFAMQPPRISFHQEGNLEDWSESLFNVIGKRSSVLTRRESKTAASVKWERRTTIRPLSPPLVSDASTSTLISSLSDSVPPKPVAPCLPDVSIGADLTLGSHAKPSTDGVKEVGEHKRVEVKDTPDRDITETVNTTTVDEEKEEEKGASPRALSNPVLPDVFLGPNVSSLGKDLEPPVVTSPEPVDSSTRVSIDSIPPPPPPKPKSKPKPAPLALPMPVTLGPPKTNVITGVSGKSPANALFCAKVQPLPLPIPISPSQIRAQLRPAPPKPAPSPPTLPLSPMKRIPSQPNLHPPPQTQLPPIPLLPVPSFSTPRKTSRYESITLQKSPNSRPGSSQTLQPSGAHSGDRDSGLSTITVTPVTIATAKTEVVRTAVASVVDSDTVSLTSQRESGVITADAEPRATPDEPDIGRESPQTTQEHREVPDESLISETSSVSLLRDGPQSKWPSPPPPPVEFETDSAPRRISRFRTTSLGRVSQLQAMGGSMGSPVNSHSSHGSSETMSSLTSENAILLTKGVSRPSPTTIPKTRGCLAPEAKLLTSRRDTFGGVDAEHEREEGNALSSEMALSKSHKHPLLVQLQPYITPCNPKCSFSSLVEIAEGESGSVFAARVVSSLAESRSRGGETGPERPIPPGMLHVAIKRIPLPSIPSLESLSDDSPVSSKLVSVKHELDLLKNLNHEHLLLLDAVYLCSDPAPAEEIESANTVDTSLWIRMELMERSLADVIGLVAEGLVLQERLVGRFASDILLGLDYLQKQHIAHRDVRSDNLLVNACGLVKLADFSSAIRVDADAPVVNGAVGVIYWQAPEMRTGPYDALKVDVWSLGATVWELAETVPPFSMPASPSAQVTFQTARHIGSQWPPLSHPEHYSRAFSDFLRSCGKEPMGRPSPAELLNTQFIRNACGRTVILQLLSQCRSIEEAIAAREATDQS